MSEVTEQQRQEAITAMNLRLREKLQYFHKLSKEDAESHVQKTLTSIEEMKRELSLYSQVLTKKHGVTVKSPWAIPSKEDRDNYVPKPAKTKSGRVSLAGLSQREKLLVKFMETNKKLGMSESEARTTADEQLKGMGL